MGCVDTILVTTFRGMFHEKGSDNAGGQENDARNIVLDAFVKKHNTSHGFDRV